MTDEEHPPPSDPATVRRRWVLLAFAGVLGLHLGLLGYYAPPRVMFSNTPVYTIDYSLHFYQVDRAKKAFDDAGRLWGYDPHVLAGQPAGAIEDLSSKSLELFVIAADRLGVPAGLAFNLYILLVHLLVPFIGYLAARLFGVAPLRAVIVALLWVLLWFFDSFLHWVWYCGMISWAATSYLVVLLVALLYRTLAGLRRGPPERAPTVPPARIHHWLGLVLLAALAMLIHPFACVALLLPCLGLYLRHRRELALHQHALLWLAVLGALATTLIWLVPALELRHYIMDSTSFLKPTPVHALLDFLDVMMPEMETGGPVRTMLRMLCFVAAGFCLYRWRNERDGRFLPLILLLGGAIAWAYFGGLFWITKQMQPHRHISPATLAAAIPAAVLLAELFSRAGLRRLDRRARIILVLALVLAVPRLVRTALYYMPELIPRSSTDLPAAVAQGNLPSGLAGLNEPRPYRMGHTPVPPHFARVRAWLLRNHRGGRVLVENYELGEYLAWSTDLPILGGLKERNVPHVDANQFRINRDGYLPPAELAAYFERYAVSLVVTTAIRRKLEWRNKLLEFRVLLDPHRVYETTTKVSYFARGSGTVHQAFNRITVEDASGPEVVLRFHWLETLRCRPGCKVERQRVKGDRVGWIRVVDPPRRFEIYNSYRFR